MKKVLVSGYIGFNNFGDEAIFYVLLNHLKSLNYEVSVLSGNKYDTEKKYNIKAYSYKTPNEILNAIFNCDILFSGGGSLLQNKTSNFSLFYYLFIIFLAKLFNKKVIIFAQGFEPIKGKLQEFILKTVLKTVDFITVRDNKSKEYLEKLKINSTLVSDPVYYLTDKIKPEENKKGLIVQLRNFKGINSNILKHLSQAIAKNYKGDISVFSFQGELDKAICLVFINELKKYKIEAQLYENKTLMETIDIINKAEFIISMRLHGLIASIPLKTNVFSLKYDDKIDTISKELDIANIDIYNYTEDELDNKLNAFFNHKLNEVHPYRPFEWECIDNSIK